VDLNPILTFLYYSHDYEQLFSGEKSDDYKVNCTHTHAQAAYLTPFFVAHGEQFPVKALPLS